MSTPPPWALINSLPDGSTESWPAFAGLTVAFPTTHLLFSGLLPFSFQPSRFLPLKGTGGLSSAPASRDVPEVTQAAAPKAASTMQEVRYIGFSISGGQSIGAGIDSSITGVTRRERERKDPGALWAWRRARR